MTRFLAFTCFCVISLLTACTPVKTTVINQYTVDAYSQHRLSRQHVAKAIYVSPPEATAAYQTNAMRYIKKPYKLQSFTKNTWSSPPADLLYPLIIQSLQKANYFHAVTSGYYPQKADYRLDVQLIEFEQNFVKQPSTIRLVVKAVVTRVNDGRVFGSRIFTECVPCPADTPYGGVIAANRATLAFTAALTDFAIEQVRSGE